jgi:hypothetical protein
MITITVTSEDIGIIRDSMDKMGSPPDGLVPVGHILRVVSGLLADKADEADRQPTLLPREAALTINLELRP